MKTLKPPRLRKGAVIGLVSPASAPRDAIRVQKAVRYLEALGYRVKLGRHVGARHGYLAGTDAQRIDDFNRMLSDPQVRAIFALRGGYGTPRILPWLDYAAARSDPKVIVGYSDITALQLALFRRAGLVTFSGPMAAVDFAEPDPFTEEHFWRLITSRARVGPLTPAPLVSRRFGAAQGILLGGNLSLLVSNLGTAFSPAYRRALLVLEDVDEDFHRLDRMFTQLRNAGVLGQVAGLVFGQFTRCSARKPAEPHLSLRQILDEVITWVDVPVLEGLPYGHVRHKITLPWGVTARLDAGCGGLEVVESAVS